MQVIAIGRARRQLFNQDEAGRGSTSPCVQRAAVSYRIVDERWLDGAKDVTRDAGSSVYNREEVRKELAFDWKIQSHLSTPPWAVFRITQPTQLGPSQLI
jgi:hypothetical protein